MAIEYANEILAKIDKATGKAKEKLLQEYGANLPANMLLSLNFDERLVLDLPEGMPPYKVDLVTHPDLFPSTLARELPRLKSLIKGRNDLTKVRREHIFIQILESIPPKEAEVMVFAKDRALTELYPTITYKLVEKVFPNYCFKLKG